LREFTIKEFRQKNFWPIIFTSRFNWLVKRTFLLFNAEPIKSSPRKRNHSEINDNSIFNKSILDYLLLRHKDGYEKNSKIEGSFSHFYKVMFVKDLYLTGKVDKIEYKNMKNLALKNGLQVGN